MRLCCSCALEWASPMNAPDADWYELAYRVLDLYPEGRWEFERVLASCGSTERIFDIGCGDGAFLRRCAAAGIVCRGGEFAPASVNRALQAGLPVRLMDLDRTPAGQDQGDATVVTAFQVLEHLGRPEALFEQATAMSAPGASLWVGVPSRRRPSRTFGERDILDQPPHHLTRWSEAALRQIGGRNGWRLLSIDFEPLPLRSALWWMTTRTSLYRTLAAAGGQKSRILEAAARMLGTPLALAQRLTVRRHMTGFTMLARFEKLALPDSAPAALSSR